jgi:UDP-N-acetylglucosamine 1-carboxyvinyltransferase
MCSSNSRKVIINNIPDIIDINKLITLLENLGVNIQKNGPGSYTQADDLNLGFRNGSKKEGGSLRGSIMIVGPLLARLVKVIFQNQVVIK